MAQLLGYALKTESALSKRSGWDDFANLLGEHTEVLNGGSG